MRYLLFILLTTALAVVYFLLNVKSSERLKECRVIERQVVKAVYGSGRVRGERQVLLRASVSGYVSGVYAREGERVSKGQLLARIDDGGLSFKLEALKKRIEVLRERLEPESGLLKSLKAKVRAAQANLKTAESRLARREELFAKGVIPKEVLEEARRAREIALRELEASRARLSDTLLRTKKELEALEEEHKALKEELKKYEVRSPMDGILLKSFIQEGDYVNVMGGGNLMFSLASRERKVVLSVDEEFFPLIKIGQEVVIRSDAYPDRAFVGRVVSVSPQSEISKRSFEVDVKVDLPKELAVDSLVEGNVVVSRYRAKFVPSEAVKGNTVLVEVDGKMKKVKVLEVKGELARIEDSVPAGSRCVVY